MSSGGGVISPHDQQLLYMESMGAGAGPEGAGPPFALPLFAINYSNCMR